MRGLIIDPGIVVHCDQPIRPLTEAERAERDRFIAANRAAGRVSPPSGARLVARIDEDGRDRVLPIGRLRA